MLDDVRGSDLKYLSMHRLLLMLFLALQAWNAHGTPFLLFANRKDIRMVDVSSHKPNTSTVIINHLEDATSLDFFYEDKSVFWADINLEMIKRTQVNSTAAPTNIVTTGLTSPDALACDWIARKLYWTDSDTNRIEVSSLDGQYRKVLFWERLDQPRAIALVPMEGIMFWTDWGEMPKIERAAMDGDHSTREVIVNSKILWPNGLTVDYEARRIFWADGKLNEISSSDYVGGHRETILSNDLPHPFSLTIFKGSLYWTDWQTRSIHMFNKSSGTRKVFHIGSQSPMGIHAFAAERQPYSESPCRVQNGGCSHLCLLSPKGKKYSCACPTGVQILADNHTCAAGAQDMLLLARRTDLRRISLDTPDFTDVVLQLRGVKHAITLDYDPIDGYVYWTDDEVRAIRRAFLNGTGQEDLVVTEVYHPDGLAVDWMARNLYWTDTGTDRIEVARLNGSSRKILITHDLDEPRAIVVDPADGYMYWTDWGKLAKIERAALDGSERTVIIGTDLIWPNGLALDYEARKIYWGDAKTDKIEFSNLDGSDRRELVSDRLPHLFGFSLLGDYLYWTDWQRRSIEKVNKKTGSERETIVDQLPDLMGLKAISVRPFNGTNLCAVNNGNCSHLCLNRPNGIYVCACPMGMELANNHKLCIVPEAFLLFSRRDDIRRISLESQHNDVAIPVAGIKQASALDFDINDNRIYWTDITLKTICRAFMNGSNLEQIISLGLEFPEGMAVDWVAHNVYWADTGSKRIEVARLDGTSRRVLIWQMVDDPRSLALDPSEGYMYWSDWGGTTRIERAAMDGSHRQPLVQDVKRTNGLTIDYSEKRLYWIDVDSHVIESCDMQGEQRMQIVSENLPHPYGLTQYQDYIYWTDWNTKSIERANKTSGDNRTRIQGHLDLIVDILVFHASRQSGWNICAQNNGGCSHLCLAQPTLNGHQDFIDYCACPTHYELAPDNRTCIAPKAFLLYSVNKSISRMTFNIKGSPDVALPIFNLKNVKELAYDSLDGVVYWIDGRINTIRRASDNGTGAGVFLPNPSSSFHIYDMAIDPYTRLMYWTCATNNVINVTRLDSSPVGVVVAGAGSPRTIALHPLKGFMFWTNLAAPQKIERASLDGMDRVTLFDTEIEQLGALTVDTVSDLIFWCDLSKRRIEVADIMGGNRKTLVETHILHPSAVAVHGRYLYWMDKETHAIERVLKESGMEKETVISRVALLSDVIAVDHISLEMLQSHPCHAKNGECSHLCVVKWNANSIEDESTASGVASKEYRCSCPVDLVLKEDEKTCGDPPTCAPDHFRCEGSGACIPLVWRCEGYAECDDKSDEINCHDCADRFRCHNGDCIDKKLVCDGHPQCEDGSDEKCCKKDDFYCVAERKCILKSLVCNGKADCGDGSDEENCSSIGHSQYGGDESAPKHNFTLIVIIVCILVVTITGIGFICRRRRLAATRESDECAEMMAMMSSNTAPTIVSSLSRHNGLMAAPAGKVHMQQLGVNIHLSNGSAAAVGRNAISSSCGESGDYERPHVTGASSSGSSVTHYPQETLNPPPSPVTDRSACSAYCCSSHMSSLAGREPGPIPRTSYRQYRVRNRPPPPTPCSTDVYDDSEPYSRYVEGSGRHRRRYYPSRVELGYDSGPYPPPPTPRSHYLSDENCTSCPPSPSTERSFCNPCNPPPSPVAHAN